MPTRRYRQRIPDIAGTSQARSYRTGRSTYGADQDKPQFWDTATCREADCRHWLEGWKTILPVGDHRIDWIKHKSERYFTEEIDLEAGLHTFVFEYGQKCFTDHEIRNGRDPILYRADGGVLLEMGGDEWTTKYNEQVHQVGQAIKAGSI